MAIVLDTEGDLWLCCWHSCESAFRCSTIVLRPKPKHGKSLWSLALDGRRSLFICRAEIWR
jgi:hypothetical protein